MLQTYGSVDKMEQKRSVQDELNKILAERDIQTYFQPIISLRDGSVLGYEALSRGPVNSVLRMPTALFAAAETYGRLWELENLCRTRALETVMCLQAGIKLFLNVNPATIYDTKFQQGFTADYLKPFGLSPGNLHFEITERSIIKDFDGFKNTIEYYKRQDYKIAIDDAGAGYSGLNLITDVRPHYIKLDIQLIRDIDQDGYKRAMVKSLYEFSRLTEISLIAEGIEREEELDTLIDIGVHYGQGYFIQRPQPRVCEVVPEVLEAIRIRNEHKNHTYYHYLSNIYIGNLCYNSHTVSSDTLSEDVYQIFLKDSALLGITVVNHGVVEGLVTKTHIDHMMSGPFGFSLHARRPISLIMDKHPLIVDHQMPIDVVSKMAMSRPTGKLYDCIVVTNGGRYAGIVTIKTLLEKTTEIEVSNARHQNPLTGLPGNMLIEQNLGDCIKNAQRYAVLYIDIDNFKAYNDVYGFEKGDGIIGMLARSLEHCVPRDTFVGHVGGDDFIAIFRTYDVDIYCQKIIAEFDKKVREFYVQEDLQKGFIIAKNRRNEVEQYPIMSISIAGVTNSSRCFQDVYQLAEYAVVLKKKCKQQWTSCYFID